MLRLRTFGPPLVERDGHALAGAARQRRVLALLAIVAASRERGVSRDRVLALLWQESVPEKARQALTQSLYHARQALQQDDLFLVSADLRLNPAVITSDIGEFEQALDAGQRARAIALYEGPFLDGFYVNGAPEFERWASDERARLKERCAAALEELATEAAGAADLRGAVEWRKRLAALEPLSSRIALELMRAMADFGDRAGAIRHAQIHELLLRQELEVAPSPDITEFAHRLRSTDARTPLEAERWTADPRQVADPQQVNEDRTADSWQVNEGAGGGEPNERRVSKESERPRQRLWKWVGGLTLLAAVVIASAVLMTRPTPEARTTRAANMTVVAPFRVAGADPTLAYLREGLVDLLVTKLTDDAAARAADPGAVMSAWRRAGFAERSDVPRVEALKVARQLGGSRLLLGSVVGTPNRLVVSAAVLELPDGTLRAQASAEGPADSLTAIVDRLVARLLATEAGELERLASHTSSSVEALRAYLEGQASYRRGSYRDAVRHFRRALERDSSFAMAALGLAHAADRIGAQYDRATGLAAAWAARGELTERDNIYLQALAGPRYPAESSPREYVAAWERATARIPDRADAWHELGERLFTDGRLLGLRDWEARAAAAFRRAAELDPAFASPYQYLMQLAAKEGDSASVRRLALTYLRVDSAGELAPFVRWRSAIALGDSARLRTLRRQLASFPAASLRSIALSSQYNGIAAGDAERALDALTSRAARGAERADLLLARHALSINRGEFGGALEVTERLAEDRTFIPVAQQLRVLDWLYAGANEGAATSAASRLASRLPPADTTRSGVAVVSLQRVDMDDGCVLGQWRAWTDGGHQSDSARALPLPAMGPPFGMLAEPCATLVDAIIAVRARAPDAIHRVERLDSLLQFGPPVGRLHDYVGLALARLYHAVGDDRRALAAVRRRPHMWQWPHYLVTHIREEGRLAVAVGDSTSAVAAYRHYLALRPSPEAAARADVEVVRAELARLTRSSD